MTKKFRSSVLIFLFILLLALFAIGKSFSYSPSTHAIATGTLLNLSDQWEAKTSNDFFQDYTYTIPSGLTGITVLSLQLEESSAQLFLDGFPVSSQATSSTLGGTIRWWVTLPQDSGGSVLTLRLPITGDTQRVLKGNSYLGESGAVFAQILQDNLYALVFGVFALLLGVVILIADISIQQCSELRRAPTGAPYLSGFILFSGLWVMCNSQIPLLFTGRSAPLVIMSFLSFYGMPILLLLYVQHLLSRPSRLLRVLWVLQTVDLAVILLWDLLSDGLLSMSHWEAQIIMIVSLAALLVVCIRDLKKRFNQTVKDMVLALPCLGIFAFLSLVSYYCSPNGGHAYLYSAGIILFVVFLACSAGRQLYHHVKQSINAEVYQKLAYTDCLTGLKSRAAYEERLVDEEVSGQEEIYAVFDVNNLKHINDTFGHQSGDKAIAGAAQAIQKGFLPLGDCFRVGGDEFLAILPGATEKQVQAAAKVMEDELTRLSKDSPFPIRVAMGWSSSAQRGARGLALFHQADVQMYQNKRQSKGMPAI